MFIKYIRTENFKGLPNKRYDFKNLNVLSGKNGSGKTSVGDAILWTIYGELANSKAIVLKHGELRCGVEICINVEGKDITIERIQQQRTKGTIVKVGGIIVTQKELEDGRLGFVLPDYRVFASSFRMGFFTDILDKNEQRNTLLSFFKSDNSHDLFIKLGGTEELLKEYNIDLSNLDQEFKRIKELKSAIKGESERMISEEQFIKSEVDKLNDSIELDRKNTPNDIEQLYEKNKEKIESMNLSSRDELVKTVVLYNSYKAGIDAMDIESINTEKGNIEKFIEENRDIDIEIKTVDIAIALSENDTKAINMSIGECNGVLRSMKNGIIDAGKLGTVCNLCKQEVSEEHKNKIISKTKEDIKLKESELVELENKEKKEFTILSESKKTRSELVNIKNDVSIMKNRLVELNGKIDSYNQQVENIKSIDIDKINNDIIDYNDMLRIRDAYKEYCSYKKIIDDRLATIERHNDKLSIIDSDIKKYGDRLDSVEKIYKILSPSGMQSEDMRNRIENVYSTIKGFGDGLTIQTLDTVKSSGELKEVFILKYKDVEYEHLSDGEKIKVQLIICKLFNILANNIVGCIFFDKLELLDGYSRDVKFDGQMFIAVISDEQSLLLSYE